MKREELEPAYIMLNAYYSKDEADSVMDEMEMTLACYEDEVHQLRKQLEDVQNTMATENVDLGMENHKLKERIKELEADKLRQENYCESLVNENKRLNEIIISKDMVGAELANENKALRYNLEDWKCENEALKARINELESRNATSRHVTPRHGN